MNGTEMAEPKHQAIKLFGRKIPVPDTQMPASSLSKNFHGSCREVTKVKVGCSGDKDKQDDGSSDQEKVLKKPDKIVPCPRCNSLETKFCYFNNYNVNQPRHFCRNCQRYWTAGGAMRNVPVGAGRRKNKHLPSQFCRILATSDGIPVASMESSDPATHHLHPCDNVEEPSLSGSSNAASKCTEQALIPNANSPNHAQWSPAPVLAAQGLGPSNIPLHFIPASYWGCVPVWASGTGNGSPNLGKHCRDSHLSEEKNPEKCLFAPKTKRIDHCNEASKSPLWDALGLKPDGKDAMPNESELLL